MTYANGTWTLTQKHEKMIKTAQRKMLRLIVQTKKEIQTEKSYSEQKDEGSDKSGRKEKEGTTDKETEEGSK